MPAVGSPLNNTARVLLGMIAEGHCTGYSIKAEIDRSTRLYWGASVGGIYPELRRLTELGLVEVRDDPRGGARRHAYALTATGREALHEWLTSSCEQLVLEMRNEGLLRLRFAGVLEASEQLLILRRLRRVHEERGSAIEALLQNGDFDDPLHRLAVEYGLEFHRWAASWCADAERRLAQRRSLSTRSR